MIEVRVGWVGEWRCVKCGSLLGRFHLAPGSKAEIKCRCGKVNELRVLPASTP